VAERDELICLDPITAKELRDGCISEEHAERLSDQLKALADPTRLRLAAAMGRKSSMRSTKGVGR
jgi:hypothetical protein